MSASTHESEALVFAEDLINSFFQAYKLPYTSTSGARYERYIRRHFNDNMLWIVHFFTQILSKPRYKTNHFPNGYNVLDFLDFCGKVAFDAIRDFQYGIVEAGDQAISCIASCLKEFINSGEFERKGGWSELTEVSSRLCRWNVFCSVVCIGNKYGL